MSMEIHDRRFFVFFFNDTATTEIYTLSLHDALPISGAPAAVRGMAPAASPCLAATPRSIRCGTLSTRRPGGRADRKSTRLNSSHANISYAVFCLKKKKTSTRSYSFSFLKPQQYTD